jgi:hypothetical protein
MEENNKEDTNESLLYKTWRKIVPSKVQDQPQPREKFSMNVYDYSLFIFGGVGKNGAILEDFYQFDIGIKQWKEINTNFGPCGRHSHAAVIYKHHLILMGGKDENDNILDDLWSFNFKTNTWKFHQECNLPRYGHALNIVSRTILRLIGSNKPEQGAVYDWNLENTLPKFELSFASYKSQLSYFAAVSNEKCTFVYGGDDKMAILSSRYSSDIFKVTPVTRVNGLTAELVDEISENYLLIGGLHEDKTPAKTQIFYKVRNKFISLSEVQLGELPQLSYHKSVSVLNSVFVFGGVKSNGELSNELYQYSDLEDWSQPVTVYLPEEIFLNEVCKYLPPRQLLKIARTSRPYYQLITTSFHEILLPAKVSVYMHEYVSQRHGVDFKILGDYDVKYRMGMALMGQRSDEDELDPTLEECSGKVDTCYGKIHANANIGKYQRDSTAALLVCNMSDPDCLTKLGKDMAGYSSLKHVVVVGIKANGESTITTAQLENLAVKFPGASVILISSTNEVFAATKILVEKILMSLAEVRMSRISGLGPDPFIYDYKANTGKKDKCGVM